MTRKKTPEQQAASRAKATPKAKGTGRKPPPEATRFRPGQSGNPGGRPKGRSLTSLIREVLDDERNGKTVAEALARKIVDLALKGRFDAIALVMERTDGKVTQPLLLDGQGGAVQTHIYLPDNGRDRPASPGDPPAAGPAGSVPGQPG